MPPAKWVIVQENNGTDRIFAKITGLLPVKLLAEGQKQHLAGSFPAVLMLYTDSQQNQPPSAGA